MRNIGAATATNFQMIDNLIHLVGTNIADVRNVQVDGVARPGALSGSIITVEIPELAPGEHVTITFQATVIATAAGTTFTNTANLFDEDGERLYNYEEDEDGNRRRRPIRDDATSNVPSPGGNGGGGGGRPLGSGTRPPNGDGTVTRPPIEDLVVTTPWIVSPLSPAIMSDLGMYKIPDRNYVRVGETLNWTLSGFNNRSGETGTDFTIIDFPGLGLNFASGRLPAFTNGAGITYDIRYRVAGSNEWRTYLTGIDASQPFNFSLPQSGSLHYTHIGFFFGDVPADFGLGNEIVQSFVVDNNAPDNILVNRFIVSYGDAVREAGGVARVISDSPTWRRNPITGDDFSNLGLILSAIGLMLAVGGTSLIVYKRKKKQEANAS